MSDQWERDSYDRCCSEDYYTYIRGMTWEERQRSKEKEQCNNDSNSEQQERD